MNRQLIQSGAALCSTLLLYSWVQPSASEPDDIPNCNVPQKDVAQSSSSTSCASNAIALPEKLSGIQWGNRSAGQLPTDLETVYNNLLEQAQVLASREKLTQALSSINGIPKNSRYYAMAQHLQEDWSRELLRQATTEFKKANVANAISMLNSIPSSSQFHARAVELHQRWNQQAKLLEKAITAQKASDWQGTIDAIQALESTPMYHSLKVQELLQQAMIKLYEPNQTLLQIATSDLTLDYY